MEKENNRILWIDTARGLGILFVVWGHYASDGLAEFFYTFHVPLFFVLSGYLFKVSNNESFKSTLRKLSKSLLIPYLSLGLFMAAAQCIIDRFYRGIQGKSAVLHVWESFIVQNRWTTLWFIAVLFLSELLLFLLVKLFEGNKKLLTAAVLACAIIAFIYYRHNGRTLPWNIDICPVAILFMYIGHCLRSSSGFQKLMSSDTKRQLLFAGLFLLLNLILSRLNYAVSGW